jgi:phosphate transport system protein
VGSSLVERLERAERQAVADLLFAANSLMVISAAIDNPAARRTGGIASSAQELRGRGDRARSDLIGITATHAPVAGDLRLVLALIELAHHCTLLANQFDLIAEQLGELDPDTRDRVGNGEKLCTMAALASVQVRAATDAFRMRDLKGAERLDRDDDVLDALNREICDAVAQLDSGAEERDLGFRQVLIARSLERIGDNAVDVGEQTVFVVTGRRTEFSDASQPGPRILED